jgi:hypothetical protein
VSLPRPPTRHPPDQARVQTTRRDRAGHRPSQGTSPHGSQSPRPCKRRCHQRRARCRWLQLPPPPRLVAVFVVQNPGHARSTRTAQIGLKPASSRTTLSANVLLLFELPFEPQLGSYATGSPIPTARPPLSRNLITAQIRLESRRLIDCLRHKLNIHHHRRSYPSPHSPCCDRGLCPSQDNP